MSDVVEAMEKADLEKVVTPYGSLRLFHRELREFDIQIAKEVLSKRLFDAITKTTIDREILDARIKTGEVDSRLAEKFIKSEKTTELRLYGG